MDTFVSWVVFRCLIFISEEILSAPQFCLLPAQIRIMIFSIFRQFKSVIKQSQKALAATVGDILVYLLPKKKKTYRTLAEVY